MSYLPFFGGKRICFGRMFVETAARMNVFLLTYYFDFEFVDPKYNSYMPPHNVAASGKNNIELKMTPRKQN